MKISVSKSAAQLEDITLAQSFLRLIIGFGSGLLGTVVLTGVIFATWSIIGQTLMSTIQPPEADSTVLAPATEQHPLFLVIVTLAIFLGGFVTSLLFAVIIINIEERFHKTTHVLTHVFFGNLVLLFFSLPLYLLGSFTHNQSGVMVAGALHATLVGTFTYLAKETSHPTGRSLLTVYTLLFCLTLAGFFLILASKNFAAMSFLLFPIIYCCIGFGSGISTLFYQWLRDVYSCDFLQDQ